jgi:hypothetical protein
MCDFSSSAKKRPIDSDHTSEEEDGYDTDATLPASSPYNREELRELEREYNRKKLERQNREYERRQLLPNVVAPTVILDRKTNREFYIKNSEGELETVTSANIRSGNTFYNEKGQQITPQFLDFTGETGGKIQ